MVSDQLEAADDLANGEEAEELSSQDAATHDLSGRDVLEALEGARRAAGGSCGAGGLQQGAGVLDGSEGAVEVALEGGDGAAG